MGKSDIEEKAQALFLRAYKAAKTPFGHAWGLLPEELRVLYVKSRVLESIAAIIVDEVASLEGKARIAEYCNRLAYLGTNLDKA